MNHLAIEKSPYLQQHKDNPVNWYPWNEEAFELALKENKPVFLSIGYSTCHWCHVMAHESFMDTEVARLMNRTFINIKVDREERPDIDQIYMSVCQMLTGSGGWPLSIIMTPDKKPFFAATYIPKNGRSGRYGMIELMDAIEKTWKNDSAQYTQRSDLILKELIKANHLASENFPTAQENQEILNQTYQQFQNHFDIDNGGFGYRPKFPSPHNLLFLMQYYSRNKKNKSVIAMEMVEKTLIEMRKGGVYDQIGYGFHRYSTDERWFLPHFEKMLYDQAMHLMAYSRAYQVTGHTLFKITVEEIIDYVIREMQSPEGGYFSAQDADSEGEEGKFYVWNYQEVKQVLNPAQWKIFMEMYAVEPEGNFHEEASGKSSEKNIIYIIESGPVIKYSSNPEVLNQIKEIHRVLLEIRNQRVHPLKDDKILTNWNGLMIAAMTEASEALSNQTARESALKAENFISQNLLNTAAAHHRYRDQETSIDANLEDYAFYIYALLQLYHSGCDLKHLNNAVALTEIMVKTFFHEEQGGFYFTSEKSFKDENLVLRPQDFHDSAIPCGNSVAFYNLIYLKKYTGSDQWNLPIEKTIQAYNSMVQVNPTAHSFYLIALDLFINPGMEIIINGNEKDIQVQEAAAIIRSGFFPGLVYHKRNPDNFRELAKIAPFTAEMGDPGKLSFFICENYSCQKPIYELSEFLKTMERLQI